MDSKNNLNPILLQKQIRDNASDLQDFCKDLKQWGDDMKRKEERLKESKDGNVNKIPLPRAKVKKTAKDCIIKKEFKEKVDVKANKLKSFADWEKFDVEAECAKIDSEKNDSDEESDLTDEFDESMRDEAINEKEKGNKHVKKQNWDSAIECYTHAIECYAYDPVFYANRALCYLKKEKYKNAEVDCTTALQLDKTYVKAYQRRAAAREALGQLSEAHSDLLKVFDYEPNNKESKNALSKIEKKLEKVEVKNVKKPSINTVVQRPVSKFTLSRQQHKQKTAAGSKEEETTILDINKAKVIERKEGKPQLNEEKLPQQKITKIANKIDNIKVSSWSSGSDVHLIKSISKPPHMRSKKSLKRIEIKDITYTNEISKTEKLEHETAYPKPNHENSLIINCDDLKIVERTFTNTQMNYNKQTESDINVIQEKDSDKKSKVNMPIPKTYVQFCSYWKQFKTEPDLKFLYLSQIPPNDLPNIFKESLDSGIFSEILLTLTETFIERNKSVFEYLEGLTQVKRFSTLIMFMSSNDKNCFLKLIDFMRTDKKHSSKEVDDLIIKYGL